MYNDIPNQTLHKRLSGWIWAIAIIRGH